MSSSSIPLSPIVNNNDDDHTDEDKTEPYEALNTSAASNSSNDSNLSEVPAPSSSAAGILQERLRNPLPVNRLNLYYSPDAPISLTELEHRCRPLHYYNNPTDEYTFLTDTFLPFMGMLMVSNLLYWLPQLGEGFETTFWFTSWGYHRIFLEALEQALSRLPYPRIYNCADVTTWIEDLHSQSKNIALTPYPWAEKAQLSPFAPRTYKPITEHYCIHHRSNIQGFIIGAQDGTGSQSILGGWRWKFDFFTRLPQYCLNFIQDRLPGFQFNLPTVAVAGVSNKAYSNPSDHGFWSVIYDQVWLEHTQIFDYDFSDVVPEPDVVHSGCGFSAIDNTAFVLPYQSTGSSLLPTDHLQPGYLPVVTPYSFHPGYYIDRPVSAVPSPSASYSLMPSNIREQLTTLTDKVEGLSMTLNMTEYELRLAQEDLYKYRIELGKHPPDALVNDVDSLKHKVSFSNPQSLSDRVEYLETWIDNHVEEWGRATSAQDAIISRVEVEMARLQKSLRLSNLRVELLEQALLESKNNK
jgi:hypothetical protein